MTTCRLEQSNMFAPTKSTADCHQKLSTGSRHVVHYIQLIKFVSLIWIYNLSEEIKSNLRKRNMLKSTVNKMKMNRNLVKEWKLNRYFVNGFISIVASGLCSAEQNLWGLIGRFTMWLKDVYDCYRLDLHDMMWAELMI